MHLGKEIVHGVLLVVFPVIVALFTLGFAGCIRWIFANSFTTDRFL